MGRISLKNGIQPSHFLLVNFKDMFIYQAIEHSHGKRMPAAIVLFLLTSLGKTFQPVTSPNTDSSIYFISKSSCFEHAPIHQKVLAAVFHSVLHSPVARAFRSLAYKSAEFFLYKDGLLIQQGFNYGKYILEAAVFFPVLSHTVRAP